MAGLVGIVALYLRERALALGGTVHAGPAGDGRYAVTLVVPLEPWEGPR